MKINSINQFKTSKLNTIMKRDEFIKTMATTVPVAAVVPDFNHLAESDLGKVLITDVKFMRIQIGRGHVMPLVKIETDAGIYGIGECHHDVTGLGAKDVVMNAFRQILIKQDPFDIARLTEQMKFRVSYLGGNGGIGMHAVTGCKLPCGTWWVSCLVCRFVKFLAEGVTPTG